jgi:hypothetical protein
MQIASILERWILPGISITLAEIRSVTGILFFVSNGFFLGRATLSEVFNLKTAAEAIGARTRRPPTAVSVKLSTGASAAIRFWHTHFSVWNGSRTVACTPGPCSSWSQIWRGDASSEFGCGAINDMTGQFFSLEWTDDEWDAAFRTSAVSAPYLEAVCCLFQMRFWGQSASGQSVLLESDCKPAVQALNKGYSKDPLMNSIANEFHHLVAHFSVCVFVRHIRRAFNTVPDLLSRGPRCLKEALQLWKNENPKLDVHVQLQRSSLAPLFSRD